MALLTLCFVAAYYVLSSVAAIGPIDTTRPVVPGGSIANDAPPGPFFQDFKPPFPTNDWWVGYAASPSQDSVVAGPFPYMSRALDTGFQFGISNTRNFDGTSIIQGSQMDWAVSYVGQPNSHTNHKATGWDAQSVTVKYFTASLSGFTTYLVPGSPYMTFEFTGATVLLSSQNGNIVSLNGNNIGTSTITVTGTKFTVVNSAGTYAIYSLSGPITFTATATSLTAKAPFSGVLRIARVTQESTSAAVLDKYVATYPKSVNLDYTISGDTATMSFTWNVAGDASQLLHLSWPHHRKRLVNPAYVSGLSYLTTKGYMKPVLGNTWHLSYALPTITWNAPRDPQASCKQQIIQALEYEVSTLVVATPGDFYFWGKRFQTISRLALIADHVGRQDLIPAIVNILKQSFAFWRASGQSVYATYETAWGGVINGPGYNNVWVDYGNGYYNDHHFQYGYLLHGAAVIGKYDAAWWNDNKQFVSYFARDIGNPSTSKADPYFTFARNKDWFAGHSWASGIANGAGSRDQESIGEVVNGYYGLILYADVAGNQDFKNWARLLWATEVDGAQSYWHLYPHANDPDTPYPEAGVRALTTMGNVMDYQAGAWLFWGAQRSQIAAIQILPVTPINEEMYDTAWVTEVWNYVSAELTDPTVGDEWKAVIYLAYSEVNPQVAFTHSSNITGWGDSTSQTNQLYYLSTRKNTAGGNICSAAAQNPTGTFLIQNAASGKFVSSTSGAPNLVVGSSGGTPFAFGYMPGGGSIKNTITSQFVTADPNGVVPLASARAVAQAYENFKVAQQSDGSYVISAGVNSKYVAQDSTGALVNNAANVASATKFKLVAPSNPTGTFILQDAASGKFVSSTNANINLIASSSTSQAATAFQFASMPSIPDGGSVKNIATGQFVTADPNGGVPLSSARGVADAWENFKLVQSSGGAYIIIASVNSKYVTLDSTGALINNGADASSAANFKLVSQ